MARRFRFLIVSGCYFHNFLIAIRASPSLREECNKTNRKEPTGDAKKRTGFWAEFKGDRGGSDLEREHLSTVSGPGIRDFWKWELDACVGKLFRYKASEGM
ncbi:hypothetical protein AVEN_45990-1 [Araneus ventricosus]|uniref:Uncharacterized protein n=1 Tax=Araneus ventricosus TaxID=182803 RepID=A0A4Y2F7S5_ARAVE|nr:hypothetical protein AVEN_45990-1 [Araneus ventricosus]